MFIEAPKEMQEKAMMRPIGVFRDYDRDEKQLNAEEKEVFDCLVDSDQDFDLWEELDDDFVLTGNDNKPALELVDCDEDEEKPLEANPNKDVIILQGEDDEEQKALDEYRLRMAALLPNLGTSVPTQGV